MEAVSEITKNAGEHENRARKTTQSWRPVDLLHAIGE
jgi:hypothetical protein